MHVDPVTDMSTRGLVRRLFAEYLRPHFRDLLTALFFMVIAAGMTAFFAKMIEPIMDDIFTAKKTQYILPFAAAVFISFVVRGVATYIHTVIMNKTGQEIVAEIQNRLFGNLLKLDLAFFHENPSGQLSSRIINDATVLRNAIINGFTGIGVNLLTLIFLIGVMFHQDPALTVVSFVALPFMAIFVVYIGKRLRKVSGSIQTEIGNLSHVLMQIFQGIRQVKAYSMEDHEKDRAGHYIHQWKRHVIKSVRLSNLSTPFNETLVGMVVFGLISYGGYQVVKDEMTTGQLMSFITAFSMAYEPMKKLAKLNNALQMGLGAAERIFDFMDRQPHIMEKTDAKVLSTKKPAISFQDVAFAYNAEDGPALNGISFQAKAGTVTAFVGPSGSGKTTALNLVPRFYDVLTGVIDIGGLDVRDVTMESLRDHIALVSQDITIFDDTVSSNIAYGLKSSTQAQIVKAAKSANAHDFIDAMPDGYQTRLGEHGVKLSGGQRQRIAIARAMLRDAPILLLDEATSALDTESEKIIQDSLAKLQKGRTSLVIAHRLSTVQDADLILVFDQGKIAEQGTHDELIKKKGLYARMYKAGLKA